MNIFIFPVYYEYNAFPFVVRSFGTIANALIAQQHVWLDRIAFGSYVAAPFGHFALPIDALIVRVVPRNRTIGAIATYL
ncbi:MAG: hypothetical protein IKZ87_01240, partial [Actinomycetaceae bacterium]|nr:hypothetical protein [Actinomycetaceae bacterium]